MGVPSKLILYKSIIEVEIKGEIISLEVDYEFRDFKKFLRNLHIEKVVDY